MIKHVNIEALT